MSKFTKKATFDSTKPKSAPAKIKLHKTPVGEDDTEEVVKPAKFTKGDKASLEAKKSGNGSAAKKIKESVDSAERAPGNRKLKLLTKGNPKRAGSASYNRFEFYRNAKTVQAFLDAGGTLADVKYDSGKGYIEVV